MTILNQFEVSENITTSGQPRPGEFSIISDSGHEVVVNLAMPDHENSVPNEGAIVTGLGMSYIHIPVPFNAPAEDQYEMFCRYMDSLADNKVWIHCIVNARVSAFLFRYLQSHRGYSPAQAKTPVLEAWLPRMDAVWAEFIARAPAQL